MEKKIVILGAGPTGLGVLLGGVGLGGTLGGLAANALAHAERQGLIQAAWIVLMGVAILGLAASPTVSAAFACACRAFCRPVR